MKRWRRIVAGAAAIGGVLMAGGNAGASAPEFLLDVSGECTDMITVTLTPNVRRDSHDIRVDAVWFVDWPSTHDQQLVLTPIEIQGLHVGATFALGNRQSMSGFIPTSTVHDLASAATLPSIRIDITYTYWQLQANNQVHTDTMPGTFTAMIDFASCNEPQPPVDEPPVDEPPVDQPEVSPPVEEQTTTTTTLAPTTTPAPSTTTAAPEPTSTITVIGQPSPMIESVQANTAPTGFSPAPSPAAQQLPSTGSNTPITLLGAALALGSGVALVAATRRR